MFFLIILVSSKICWIADTSLNQIFHTSFNFFNKSLFPFKTLDGRYLTFYLIHGCTAKMNDDIIFGENAQRKWHNKLVNRFCKEIILWIRHFSTNVKNLNEKNWENYPTIFSQKVRIRNMFKKKKIPLEKYCANW